MLKTNEFLPLIRRFLCFVLLYSVQPLPEVSSVAPVTEECYCETPTELNQSTCLLYVTVKAT